MEISSSSPKNMSNDAIFEILSWVPPNSLMQFQWACKYWYHLIRDPKFVKMHFLHHSTAIQEDDDNKQIINNTSFVMSTLGSTDLYSMSCRDIYNRTKAYLENVKMDCYNLSGLSNNCPASSKKGLQFWGSCNGLIYFSYRYTCSRSMYFISNPCTRELKDLAEPKFDRNLNEFMAHGIGYDHTTNDYKIIRVVYYLAVVAELIVDALNFHDEHNLYNSRVINVYSLGSNSWSTKVESTPLITKDIHNIYRSAGLFINGTLHWIMKSPKSQAYMVRIISFDIVKEEHGEILLPENFAKYFSWLTSDSDLRVVNGCLCIFHTNNKDACKCLHVWMMKDYGVMDSWTNIFTINIKQLLNNMFDQLSSFKLYDLKVLKYGKDGGILLVLDENYIVFCDLSMKKKNKLTRYRVRKIEDNDQFKNLFVGATYIETLVSVNSVSAEFQQEYYFDEKGYWKQQELDLSSTLLNTKAIIIRVSVDDIWEDQDVEQYWEWNNEMEFKVFVEELKGVGETGN